jgi:hypothetical protein
MTLVIFQMSPLTNYLLINLSMARHLLSKSSFLKGLQCEKQLYLYKYHYDWKDEIDEAQEAIFERGHDVGKLAQQLFPNGVNASLDDPLKSLQQVQLTQELIENGEKVIYEAAFQYDDVLVIADILVKEKNNKWKIYEVKSSTEVKEEHIPDAAIQYYVISNSDLNVTDTSLIYINNKYVRKGELDLKKLFNIESVHELVLEQQESVIEKIQRFKEVLKKKNIPDIDVGPYCSSPYDCSFLGHCWDHVPDYSIFNIGNLKIDKKFELYKMGIIKIEEVPDDFKLSNGQRLQVESHISQKTFIDKKAIKEFLSSLTYPLYFLDFETFNPAIPLFDNSRPYQAIPFQYSLHYQETPKSQLEHFEFLGEANGDPRISFLENLMKVTEGKGDIIVYNQAFEATRLKELAEDFPKFKKQIEQRISRIKDLMTPFQKKHYYAPEMKGSYSIKAVLPALVPDLSYDDLEIADGGTASRAFESLYFEKDEKKKKGIREQLIKYCGMDTMAMVRIYEVLRNSI